MGTTAKVHVQRRAARWARALASWRPPLSRDQRPERRLRGEAFDVASATRKYLTYVVLPGWVVPGLLDWWYHRRSGIERTTGTKESLIHALMMSEAGVPIALGLLAEVNPPVLASMWSAAFVHQATAFWDVSLATNSTREVKPGEQQAHSFLESLPFMAVSLISLLNWRDASKLLSGGDRSRWKLEPKRRPLPRAYLATIGALVAVGVVVPYAEELVRCWRAARARRHVEAADDLEGAEAPVLQP